MPKIRFEAVVSGHRVDRFPLQRAFDGCFPAFDATDTRKSSGIRKVSYTTNYIYSWFSVSGIAKFYLISGLC